MKRKISPGRLSRLSHPQQTLRERPFGIDPLYFASEAGGFGDRAHLVGQEFVTALRPDRLPFLQLNREIAVDGNGLLRSGPQMHFDALFGFVVTRFVLKFVEIETGSELAIDAGKQI